MVFYLLRKTLFVSFLSLLMTNAIAANYFPLTVTLRGSIDYDVVDGYVQTPQGGKLGTSSEKRPTFSELGAERNIFYDFDGKAHWSWFDLYGGYQRNQLNGSKNLQQELITHAETIPAGTFLKSHTKMDLHYLGIMKTLFTHKSLTLSPKLELTWLDFDYRFNATAAGISSSRAYDNMLTPRLGVDSEYGLTPRISLSLLTAASIPVTNLRVITANAYANFQVYESAKITAKIFLGTGYMQIDYKDKQPFPNHLRLNTDFVSSGGLAVTF